MQLINQTNLTLSIAIELAGMFLGTDPKRLTKTSALIAITEALKLCKGKWRAGILARNLLIEEIGKDGAKEGGGTRHNAS